MKASERAVAGIDPDQDVLDMALLMHGAQEGYTRPRRVYPVPFRLIERGDRIVLGDFVQGVTGRGPCADVAVTSGATGNIKTQGGLSLQITPPHEPYLWVVEEDDDA